MLTVTIYDLIDERGWTFEPAPRLNPSGSLYEPWRLVNDKGRVVLRGNSRDDLEDVAREHFRKHLIG